MHAHMHIFNIYLIHGGGLLFKKYRVKKYSCCLYAQFKRDTKKMEKFERKTSWAIVSMKKKECGEI